MGGCGGIRQTAFFLQEKVKQNSRAPFIENTGSVC